MRDTFKFNHLGLAVGKGFEGYTSVAKGLKLKSRKFWRLIPTFVEVSGKKLVGSGEFLTHPEQGLGHCSQHAKIVSFETILCCRSLFILSENIRNQGSFDILRGYRTKLVA